MENARLARGLSIALLLLMLAGVYMAPLLPVHWSWENGVIEKLQALVLLLGVLFAAWNASRQKTASLRSIWWIATFIWTLMLGRELSWGATFLPAMDYHPAHGPVYSSRLLWWRPAVPWVGAALCLVSAFWCLRYRLISRVFLAWVRDGQFPWNLLLVFIFGMVLGTLAESDSLPLPGLSGIAQEEMAELWAYVALWCSQWVLVLRTRPLEAFQVQLRSSFS